MTISDLILMSKSSLASQTPRPPSFEDILSDLLNANSLDVAFEHPSEVCPEVKKLRGNSSISNKDRSHTSGFHSFVEEFESQASFLPTNNTGITTGEDLTRGQDKEKYQHVTDFLSNYRSLIKSTTALKELGKDLENNRQELEQKIQLVEETWKTGQE